jgi:hypothetical protein
VITTLDSGKFAVNFQLNFALAITVLGAQLAVTPRLRAGLHAARTPDLLAEAFN